MDAKRVIKGTPEFDEIYQIALGWWSFWKFPPPPMEFLPVNMVCAYTEAGPACIGFVYQTDSKISWLEWVVANPTIIKEERSRAIELVLTSAKIMAGAMGFGAVFTSSKNPSLNKKLEKKFLKTGNCMTQFIWRA